MIPDKSVTPFLADVLILSDKTEETIDRKNKRKRYI
jgi:hypothetical protein